jgi:ATP-dependent protease ClpP protease subunit
MQEYYIIFEGVIDPQTSLRFVNAITNAIQTGHQRITIFFSSLGGNIYDGFIVANFIQNARVPIAIHAVNHIDSIANVIFLSAKERTTESHAKFYLHGASGPALAMDERMLIDQLSSIRTHNSRIANFISENSSIPLQKVRNMMKKGTTISAQEALGFGFVSSIIHREIDKTLPREDIIYVN